jgi:putative inorganic carbon (hco3(-)) transporter
MKDSGNITTIPKLLTHYGLYVFAFSLPISFVPAEFAIALICIGLFMGGGGNRQRQFYPIKLYIPFAFYIAWNMLASSFSPRPAHSLFALADNEWPSLIMLVMIAVVDDVKVLKRMLYLWLTTASIAAVYGIFQTLTGMQFHRSDALGPMGQYFRATGFNGFYLTFAGFMMSVFFVSSCLCFQQDKNNRWRYSIAALVSFLAILGTFARSIWLSFSAAIPVFGFIKGRRLGSMVITGFTLCILLCLIFIPAIRDRAFSIVVPSENQTRLNLWKTTLNISKDFPVLGIGEDNFDYYFEHYKVPGFYDATGHPHNDFLNVLVNSGIPGLVGFLWIWTVVLWYGFKTQKNSSNPFLKELALGSSLAVIGFLVGGIFQNYYGTFANCWGWWLMAGFIMTSHKLSFEKKGSHT